MPVRTFWKCETKGCRHKVVKMLPKNVDGKPCLLGWEDGPRGIDAHIWAYRAVDVDKSREVHAKYGLICPAHERVMNGRTINAKHNPNVACNAKCTGAYGPDCECSCVGANHGADVTTSLR
jgi:hypothetical protein